ncbi:BA75_00352T0 [Komagataella pastoris]|uniref:BA75_00352T0 n=1 Tax=Komagataella pastoris TaxID=4922 RepID=A0A1B2J9J0_PICPA|nr:BA75_00352T0 [Komagataella pastoris]
MPLDPDRLILMTTEGVTNWSIENPTILHLFDHSIPDEPLLKVFGKSDVDSVKPITLEETFRYHVSNGNNRHVIYKTRIESAEAMKQWSIRSKNQHKNNQDLNSHSSDRRVLLDCNSSLVDSVKLFKQTARKAVQTDNSCIGPIASSKGYSKLRVESRPR